MSSFGGHHDTSTQSFPVQAYAVPLDTDINLTLTHSDEHPIPQSSSVSSNTFLSPINEAGARAFLRENRWPTGLQDTFVKNCSSVALRYFICDDSGSMSERDGSLLQMTGKDTFKMVEDSRWKELSTAIKFHIDLAKFSGAHAEFRLLNGASPVVVSPEHPEGAEKMKAFLEIGPAGRTPLCRHIKEVIESIQSHEKQLKDHRKKACVIISTDGESSDGDVALAMKPLENLPCSIVVRLCTSDERVVKYWNYIDDHLEVDIDVLDDFSSEAKEVYAKNSWLTYGEPLHRLREFGAFVKELDIIDERALLPGEIHKLATVILGGDFPHPDLLLDDFVAAVSEKLESERHVYDPGSKKMQPWIKTQELKGKLKGQKCNIM